MKILIIEDDKKIVDFLKKGLEEESYSVDFSHNGEEGYYLASVNTYDLILLDIMLPLMSGFEVCKKLRQNSIYTPIIMLTARTSTEDTIEGLDTGANDYIQKPFSFSELLARIRVQLRTPSFQKTKLEIADLELDLLTKKAKRGEVSINLTAKEFSLLEHLIKNQNRVLSETALSSMLTNMNEVNMSNLINVYIYRLRNKIDKDFDKKLIKTIRGIGFTINDE